MNLILTVLALTLSFSLSEIASASEDQHPSVSTLEEIATDSPDFLGAMEELQKIYYSKQEWDKFFAYALFYRKKFLPSESLDFQRSKFSPTLLSLEILALGKQCHWDEAKEIAEASVILAKKLNKGVSQLEEALHMIQLQSQYPNLKNVKSGAKIQSSLFKSVQLWPVNSKQIPTQHPKFFRVKISNQCVSGERK